MFHNRTLLNAAVRRPKAAGAAGNGLLTNLQAYWEFEESGTNSNDRQDSHTNNIDIQLSGSTATGVSGVVGLASSYAAGTTSGASGSTGFDLSGQWTLALWIKYVTAPTASSSATIMQKRFPNEGAVVVNRFTNLINNSNVTDSADFSYVPVNNTWFFLVCGARATTLFINVGVPSGSGLGTTVTTSITVAPTHGGAAMTIFPDGSLAGVVIDQGGFWSRGLSDADISLLYNGGAGLAYSGLS